MRIAILYYSGTGNTETMASYIASGVRETGAIADVIPISQCDGTFLDSYDRFIFGCPASAEEELEELEFLPYYEKIEPKLKGEIVALFGSYSWGDKQWMAKWEERVSQNGLKLFENGLAIQDEPISEKEKCVAFGKRFALFNL